MFKERTYLFTVTFFTIPLVAMSIFDVISYGLILAVIIGIISGSLYYFIDSKLKKLTSRPD